MTTAQTDPATSRLNQAYADLDLVPGAGLKEVREAYRRLARALHPDLNPGTTGSLMSRVNSAYNLLHRHLTQKARTRPPEPVESGPRAYSFEEFRRPRVAEPPQQPSGRPASPGRGRPEPSAAPELPTPGFSDWRLDSLVAEGERLVYRVSISGDPEAIILPVRSHRPCRQCRGSGRAVDRDGWHCDCPACAGRGRMVRADMLSLTLPSDWFPGQRLTAAGGEDGPLVVELADGRPARRA